MLLDENEDQKDVFSKRKSKQRLTLRFMKDKKYNFLRQKSSVGKNDSKIKEKVILETNNIDKNEKFKLDFKNYVLLVKKESKQVECYESMKQFEREYTKVTISKSPFTPKILSTKTSVCHFRNFSSRNENVTFKKSETETKIKIKIKKKRNKSDIPEFLKKTNYEKVLTTKRDDWKLV